MLSLSQTTGYAVRALGCLSDVKEGHLMARQIAECTGVPLPYLSKILNALVHAGLVKAKRGYQGGFSLAEPAEALTLGRIATVVEGPGWLQSCLLGLDVCQAETPCPAHALAITLRDQVRTELEQLTVADMADFERLPSRARLKRCCPSEGCSKATVPQPGRESPKSKRDQCKGKTANPKPPATRPRQDTRGSE
jgi:Rrf2 family protein